VSNPCKRCGGPDDHNHDLTGCVARLTVAVRVRDKRIAELEAVIVEADRMRARCDFLGRTADDYDAARADLLPKRPQDGEE
jgi:hypothetical protein